MHVHKITIMLLALGLACVSCQILAGTISAEAEQHYQQALVGIEHVQQLLSNTTRTSPVAWEAAKRSVNSNLERAAEQGHPAAALYQALLTLGVTGVSGETRDRTCSLLESWARKGFVAAAVVEFRKCNEAYLRFDDSSPEHQSALQTLSLSLTKNDPAQAYYPFPLAVSECFASSIAQPVLLSQKQFRAEAEYILGSAENPTDTESLKQILVWLDSSAKNGCRMDLDPRPSLRKLLRSK